MSIATSRSPWQPGRWGLWQPDRLWLYARLARLDRPAGALLLLWPTLWALWIAAEGAPSLHLLAVFVAGVFLTRSAGCVINDYADRDFDGRVERTRHRPLATGEAQPGDAFLLAAVLLGIAFALVLSTNRLTILLAFVAIPLAAVYPFAKRFTYIPQFFLGLAFSWGIPMAFAAQTGAVPRSAWLLYLANIVWTLVYDSIYAMVDRDDDLRIGIKSTAILFGEADRAIIGFMQLMFIAIMAIVGRQLQFHDYYYLALLLAAALFIYHQYLMRQRDRLDCLRAFRSNNWVGAVILAGIVICYGLPA